MSDTTCGPAVVRMYVPGMYNVHRLKYWFVLGLNYWFVLGVPVMRYRYFIPAPVSLVAEYEGEEHETSPPTSINNYESFHPFETAVWFRGQSTYYGGP